MDLTELIETRPGVRSGKPCFVGTRIAVYDVLDYLASGMTAEEIVADFPELTERHVRAAIEFAALRERPARNPGVKLRFDQNLSRRLVGMSAVEHPDSKHVAEVGLDTATVRPWKATTVRRIHGIGPRCGPLETTG